MIEFEVIMDYSLIDDCDYMQGFIHIVGEGKKDHTKLLMLTLNKIT